MAKEATSPQTKQNDTA